MRPTRKEDLIQYNSRLLKRLTAEAWLEQERISCGLVTVKWLYHRAQALERGLSKLGYSEPEPLPWE